MLLVAAPALKTLSAADECVTLAVSKVNASTKEKHIERAMATSNFRQEGQFAGRMSEEGDSPQIIRSGLRVKKNDTHTNRADAETTIDRECRFAQNSIFRYVR